MASSVKPRIQCRFCDSECIILLKSYTQHLRRKHPGQFLNAGQRREDVVIGGDNMRGPAVAGARPEPSGNPRRYNFRDSKRHAIASDDVDLDSDDVNDDNPSTGHDSTPAPFESSSDDSIYEIEEIIGHRMLGDEIQYEVKWHGYPREEATWIPPSCLLGPSAKVL